MRSCNSGTRINALSSQLASPESAHVSCGMAALERIGPRSFLSRMNKILRWVAIALVGLAVASTLGLLVRDARTGVARGLSAAVISAVPLLAVGLSFLVVQAMVRPRWTELLKNLLLAATFLLWGGVQLMTQSVSSKRLGDVVVALYVVDLAWTILARVKFTGK
jgi:hypothetical protein